MKKLIYLLFCFILFCFTSLNVQVDHLEDIHKYLTFQAWELVKLQHPQVTVSEMNNRVGGWQDGTLNGSGPWQKGKIITGAFREDKEDVVYDYFGLIGETITATHFWDVDYADDDRKFTATGGAQYENSYRKMQAFWYGKKENGGGWLQVPDYSVYQCGMSSFRVRLRYNNLANVYKYDSIWVTHLWYPESSWVELPAPVLYKDLMSYCGASNNWIRHQIEIFCWEIVGRMCHLIEDAGVPAHAHNDEHPSEYYEKQYIPSVFQNWNYMSAMNQGGENQGGLVNINNKVNPIRYTLYTTNQIAD